MDTVLILGTSGGFGQALVKAMAANNWQVTTVSRSRVSASVRLQNKHFRAYMEVTFEGSQFSFAELKSRLESILRRTLKVKVKSWFLCNLLGSFIPTFPDLYAAYYRRECSLRIDGSLLTKQFGRVSGMPPLDDALRAIINAQPTRAQLQDSVKII